MGETDLHKYLKCLGIKYLEEQNCRLIATEIYVRKSASEDWINGDQELIDRLEKYNRFGDWEHHLIDEKGQDSKWIIDVLGMGQVNVMEKDDQYDNTFYQPMKKVGTETLLRGVEVKVSRSDFNNGYVQTGLNFHYLLCPELLVKKSEVPKHIGLLYWKGGKASTVYCAKRPRRMELNSDMFDYYRNAIYQRYHSLVMSMNRDQVAYLNKKINGEQDEL